MERSPSGWNLNLNKIKDSEIWIETLGDNGNDTHINEINVATISNLPNFKNNFLGISFDFYICDDKMIVTNNINEHNHNIDTLSTKRDDTFLMWKMHNHN